MDELHKAIRDDILDNWLLAIREDIKRDSIVAEALMLLGEKELAYLADVATQTIASDLDLISKSRCFCQPLTK